MEHNNIYETADVSPDSFFDRFPDSLAYHFMVRCSTPNTLYFMYWALDDL